MPKKKYKVPFTRSRNKSYQQATSAGSINPEEVSKAVSDFIAPVTMEKGDQDQKLTLIITSLNKIHTKLDNINNDLYRDKDGVWPRLESVEETLETTVDVQEQTNFQFAIMKGVMLKQEKHIAQLQQKVEELTARQMSVNVTISGILEPEKDDTNDTQQPEEDCCAVVLNFCKTQLQIDVEEKDILVAHRIGPSPSLASTVSHPRLMVVRCSPAAKQKMLDNSKKLAKKTNANGGSFYINQQIPESVMAEKKNIAHEIKRIRDGNKDLPLQQRTRYRVKNRVLYIEGKPVQKAIAPPSIRDMIPDTIAEQEKMEKIKLWYAESKQEKGNIFTAIAAKVSGTGEINRVYRRLRQLYPAASHISLGYECQKAFGNQDDGEYSAGLCIQKALEDNNVTNKAVFVVRLASGNKLGPRRFQIIRDAVHEVLTKIK